MDEFFIKEIINHLRCDLKYTGKSNPTVNSIEQKLFNMGYNACIVHTIDHIKKKIKERFGTEDNF